MNDRQFQSWMRRMAASGEDAPGPTADAIWWRAQLRRRLDAEQRATRPIRIAEGAAVLLCWLLAGWISIGVGAGGLIAFLSVTVAIVGAAAVIIRTATVRERLSLEGEP